MMNTTIILGLLIPFIGTTLGSACVFFMSKKMSTLVQKILLGFASGVMIAASVWSLLIPAIDMSESLGKFAFLPAAIGFLLGIVFLLVLDHTVPHMHLDNEIEGKKSQLQKTTMLVLAVTLHSFPYRAVSPKYSCRLNHRWLYESLSGYNQTPSPSHIQKVIFVSLHRFLHGYVFRSQRIPD